MRKGVVYILVIIGLLSICIGTNYDYISNFIGKDKPEVENNEETEEAEEETEEKTNLINEQDYPAGIEEYYKNIDKTNTTSYLIEDINTTEVTAKEVPGLSKEQTNINEVQSKKYKLSSGVKIYLYDMRTSTNETAKASGDESIKYKQLTIDEVKSILTGTPITAYYEIDNNEVVQILIVLEDPSSGTTE